MVAALTVTASVPTAVNVSGCFSAVFTATSPNARLLVVTLSPGVAASNFSENVSVTPLALADRVTDSALVTAVTVAVKLAVLAPAFAVTVEGTLTALLVLASFTVTPPLGAAAFSITVHWLVPAPVMIPFTQVKALTPGALSLLAVPLRPIAVVPALAEPLAIVSFPVADPTTVGENFTVKL